MTDGILLAMGTSHEALTDLDKAREIVSGIQLLPEVASIELKMGPDHYGTLSLWILLLVRSDVDADRNTVKRLTDFGREVQARVIDGGVTLFPYTSLKEAA